MNGVDERLLGGALLAGKGQNQPLQHLQPIAPIPSKYYGQPAGRVEKTKLDETRKLSGSQSEAPGE
jgi:hypothetical protein